MKVYLVSLNEITDKLILQIKEMMDNGFSGHPTPRKFTVTGFKNGALSLISCGLGVLFILKNDEGKFSGALCGCVSPDLVNEDLIAVEILWRVNELGKGYGNLLYDKFEKWSINRKASQIIMLAMEDKNLNKMEKFYQSRGFKLHGRQFIKEVN